MTRTSLATRHRRRIVAAVAALSTLGGIAVGAVGTPASAAGLLASSTVFSATIADDGQSIALVATVRLGTNKNGFGLTPKGTVHFSDDSGDNLGTVTLPSCLLKPCTITYTVSADEISSGVQKLTAAYSGDTLLKPSYTETPLALTRCSGGDDESDCSTYISYGAAELGVESDSDGGYILDNFGGPGLPCGVDGGGPVANVQGIGLNGDKEIYYMLTGAGAQAYQSVLNQIGSEPPPWFCYVSPDPFQAYSQDGNSTTFPYSYDSFNYYGDAPQLNSGYYSGDYVGLLDYCAEGSDGPCLEDYSVYYNTDSNQWEMHAELLTPPGDPHFGGLKLPALKL